MVTGKRRERDLLITSDDASPGVGDLVQHLKATVVDPLHQSADKQPVLFGAHRILASARAPGRSLPPLADGIRGGERRQVTAADLPFVSFRCTYTFRADGAVITSDSTLRFHGREEVESSLAAQGYRALRIGWPTTDPAWPAWALPGLPAPGVIRRGDGTPIPALAASDLTAAVLAALGPDGGGFEAAHILGDDDSGRCWSTAKARALLGWQPSRH